MLTLNKTNYSKFPSIITIYPYILIRVICTDLMSDKDCTLISSTEIKQENGKDSTGIDKPQLEESEAKSIKLKGQTNQIIKEETELQIKKEYVIT